LNDPSTIERQTYPSTDKEEVKESISSTIMDHLESMKNYGFDV
jgi:hypothetical protein